MPKENSEHVPLAFSIGDEDWQRASDAVRELYRANRAKIQELLLRGLLVSDEEFKKLARARHRKP